MTKPQKLHRSILKLTGAFIILDLFIISLKITYHSTVNNLWFSAPQGTFFYLQLIIEGIIFFKLIPHPQSKYHEQTQISLIDLTLIVPGSIALMFLIFPINQIFSPNNLSLWYANQPSIKIILVFILLALFEEKIFRQNLLNSLLEKFSPLWAILISSFFYLLTVKQTAQIPGTFIIGCFCGYLFWQTKKINLCISTNFIYSISSYGAIRLIHRNPVLKNFLADNFLFLTLYLTAAIIISICVLHFYRKYLDFHCEF